MGLARGVGVGMGVGVGVGSGVAALNVVATLQAPSSRPTTATNHPTLPRPLPPASGRPLMTAAFSVTTVTMGVSAHVTPTSRRARLSASALRCRSLNSCAWQAAPAAATRTTAKIPCLIMWGAPDPREPWE